MDFVKSLLPDGKGVLPYYMLIVCWNPAPLSPPSSLFPPFIHTPTMLSRKPAQ